MSLLIVANTSCNERGIAEYNRIHTETRANSRVPKMHDLFGIKHYGPKSMTDFDAEKICGHWLAVVSEDNGQ